MNAVVSMTVIAYEARTVDSKDNMIIHIAHIM